MKLYRNGELLRSKQTNNKGVVKWRITIRANDKWQTRFRGRTFPHPRDLVCEKSKSADHQDQGPEQAVAVSPLPLASSSMTREISGYPYVP